jgi:hypothetical protein
MKSYKKGKSKKQHTTNSRIHEDRENDMSNKVHHVRMEDVKMMGKQPKVQRLNISGEGLPKWRVK